MVSIRAKGTQNQRSHDKDPPLLFTIIANYFFAPKNARKTLADCQDAGL